MSNRPGVTLMEVLVAIFIMGIGMLAMLVLFPLGVLRMAQAIQDERCSQSSKNATSMAGFQGWNSVYNTPGVRNDDWVLNDPGSPALVVTMTNGGTGYTANFTVTFNSAVGSGGQGTAVVNTTTGQVTGVIITNNGTGYTSASPITVIWSAGAGTGAAATVSLDSFANPGISPMLPADPYGPSYPVFVDPMGYLSVQGQANQLWLAGLSGNSNTIPRRSASCCLSGGSPNPGLTLRWTCLLDDMPFAKVDNLPAITTGTPQYDLVPSPPLVGTFTRDIRYCWAYMLKRPRTSDHSVVDMSVVVYNGNRPILQSIINEYLYQNSVGVTEVTFHPPGNTITLDATNNVIPPCRPGDWLLDASYVPNQAGTYATVNGYFYRVVGVTQNSETNYTFEVQQPLRNMPATMAAVITQKVIFLEGVAEVFDKGPGRLP